jgi:ABC-type cobalamin/Fe3+-siderophores transport system ATPase subunit
MAQLNKAIQISNLKFGYNGSFVLDNVNIDLEVGKLTLLKFRTMI